jgi:hypothetical protein
MDDIAYVHHPNGQRVRLRLIPLNEDPSMATKNAAAVKVGPLADRVVVNLRPGGCI